MCTPYENRDTWIINAIKFRGTIFLCAEETIEKKNQKANETARDKMFCRYGFKFESYILAKSPTEDPPGNNEPVNEGEEFCVMFQAQLNNKNILYGAEMDGVEIKSTEKIKDIQQLQKASFVEVKVKRYEDNDRQAMNFYKFKGRNFWCQSFIVGIDKIHVGLRDDNGIVDDIKIYDLKELSNKARASNFWHPNVCMNFLNDFLDKVSNDMKNVDDSNLIYQYSYNPRNNLVNLRRLNSSTFLSEEFIQFLNNL
jgi:RAT1-interacting protein